MQTYTAIIIGSGFGGMTAALKLKRMGIKDSLTSIELMHEAENSYTTLIHSEMEKTCGSQAAATVGTRARAGMSSPCFLASASPAGGC